MSVANTKVSALTPLTFLSPDDILYIVANTSGVAVSRRITIQNFYSNVNIAVKFSNTFIANTATISNGNIINLTSNNSNITLANIEVLESNTALIDTANVSVINANTANVNNLIIVTGPSAENSSDYNGPSNRLWSNGSILFYSSNTTHVKRISFVDF